MKQRVRRIIIIAIAINLTVHFFGMYIATHCLLFLIPIPFLMAVIEAPLIKYLDYKYL